jgi:uncharacterized protein (DUF1778 family)
MSVRCHHCDISVEEIKMGKKVRIQVWANDQQKDQIAVAAKADRRSVSGYMLNCAMKQIKTLPPNQDVSQN